MINRNKNKKPSIIESVEAAVVATGGAHLTKVGATLAAETNSIREIIVKMTTTRVFFSTLPLNLVRGGSAVAAQDYSYELTGSYFDDPNGRSAKLAKLVAGAAAGTGIAVFAETPFSRQAFLKANAPNEAIHPKRLLKFSLSLARYYFMRELLYMGVVYTTEDHPWYYKYPEKLGGAVLAAGIHRLTMMETLNDLPGGERFSNTSRDGLKQTIKNIARGKVCAVPYPSPTEPSQFVRNFISGVWQPATVSFRVAQFFVISIVLQLMKNKQKAENDAEVIDEPTPKPTPTKYNGFFAKRLAEWDERLTEERFFSPDQ